MDRGPDSHLENSEVLPRRVGAGLVDLALIVATTWATIMAVSERFPVGRRPDGSAAFTPDQQRRLDELSGLLSRGHEVGDTLYAFSTRAVVAVLIVATLSALVVGVIVPLLTSGQSPGKLLFRLRVLGADGLKPSPAKHMIRTALGVADLMPLVVPGLTGFAFAASNASHQRIGDRLARTVVVDQRSQPGVAQDSAAPSLRSRPTVHPPTIDHPAAGKPGSESNERRPVAPTLKSPDQPPLPIPEPGLSRPPPARRAGTGPSAAETTAMPTTRTPTLNSGPQQPDLVTSEPVADVAPQIEPPSDLNGSTTNDGRQRLNGETTRMTDSANDQQHQASAAADETEQRQPVEDRAVNPYPKPMRPGRQAEEPAPSGYTALTLPESSLSDMPLTNSALFEALGLTAEQAAEIMSQPDSNGSIEDDDRAEEADEDEELVEVAGVESEPSPEPVATADILIPPALEPEPEFDSETDTEPGSDPEPALAHEYEIDEAAVIEPTDANSTTEPAQVITVDQPLRPETEPVSTVEKSEPGEVTDTATEPAALDGPELAFPLEPETELFAMTEPESESPTSFGSDPANVDQYEPGAIAESDMEPVSLAQPDAAPSSVSASPSPSTFWPQAVAVEQTSTETAAAAVSTEPARQASAPAPDKRSPIWSDDWDAWIYWDTTLRAWFRHDIDSGNWVPMEEED